MIETLKIGDSFRMSKTKVYILSLALALFFSQAVFACTGIRLISTDGAAVFARTMEWGSFDLNSKLHIYFDSLLDKSNLWHALP